MYDIMSLTMNRWFFIGTFIILLILFVHPIDTDGDFYHHMNVGKYILTHHALPRVDDLTFTAVGRPYIGNGWLSGVVFYLLYHTYGFFPINLLNYGLGLLTMVMLYWYLHRCLGVSPKRTLLALLVVAPVMATRWPYRPEMFMYVFLFGLFLIEYYKDTKPWLSLLFPVLTIVMVWFYSAGFPLVAFVFVLFVLKNILYAKNRPPNWLFYGSVIVCFPVALLNGYGLPALTFIRLLPQWTYLWGDWVGLWEIIRRPEINFSREITIIYCVFTAYVVVLMAISVKKLKAFPMFAILALTVFLPFAAERMRTFAAILSAPFIGLVLARVRSRWVIYLTIVVAAGMTALFVVTNPPGIGENTSIFPPALIQFIKTNKLSGNVFNTPRIGGFLAYYLNPQIHTFSDTRDDLFVGTGVLEATQAFLSTQASAEFLLRKYHVDMVLVSSSDGASFRDLIYNDNWALVYYRNPYLLFIPKHVAIERNIFIYDHVDPYSPTGVKGTI